jgi:hypothetical protein
MKKACPEFTEQAFWFWLKRWGVALEMAISWR